MTEKIKVLYVEDEKDIRENIVEILRDEGFKVFEAENGKHAVEIFLENKPDVVVSDIMMPGVSGYDLLNIIRNNKNIPNNNVPFIFLSALGEKEEMMKGIGLTANDYLTKPIDYDLLVAKIKEKFNNSKHIEDSHHDDMEGLKNQVSEILPTELTKYIDQIRNISQLLKTEPYGPFPHRKYLEDVNRIYINCTKIAALIDNFVSGEAIKNQINSGEDVVNPETLISGFVLSLEEKIRNRISFISNSKLPQVKVNKKIILEVVRKILSSLFKLDINCQVQISIIEDHVGQMIIIFYPESSKITSETSKTLLNKEKINHYVEKDGYNLDVISKDDEMSILLHIPSYRVMNN